MVNNLDLHQDIRLQLKQLIWKFYQIIIILMIFQSKICMKNLIKMMIWMFQLKIFSKKIVIL